MRHGRCTLFALALGLTACGQVTGPTGDPTPTPTGTVDPTRVELRSFVVEPLSITLGQPFTLKWEGSGGTVGLQRGNEQPFATGLLSSGTYTVTPQSSAYPSAEGDVVYRALIGDAAFRRDLQLHVSPPPPAPAAPPTVALSGGGSCAPTSPGVPCAVQFSASGSNYTSLSWSGCCAGTGSDSACIVDRIGDVACEVTATGAGGTTTASANARGTNGAPSCLSSMIAPTSLACCGTDATFSFAVQDDQLAGQTCSTVSVSGPGCQCAPSGCAPSYCAADGIQVRVSTGPGDGGACTVTVKYADVWGVSAQCQRAVVVSPRP